MKISNVILALFILVFFSACLKKINNTSLNEDYKILNQVSVVGTLETTFIDYIKPFGIFPYCIIEKKEDNF